MKFKYEITAVDENGETVELWTDSLPKGFDEIESMPNKWETITAYGVPAEGGDGDA